MSRSYTSSTPAPPWRVAGLLYLSVMSHTISSTAADVNGFCSTIIRSVLPFSFYFYLYFSVFIDLFLHLFFFRCHFVFFGSFYYTFRLRAHTIIVAQSGLRLDV
jgi:hypothetical protein